MYKYIQFVDDSGAGWGGEGGRRTVFSCCGCAVGSETLAEAPNVAHASSVMAAAEHTLTYLHRNVKGFFKKSNTTAAEAQRHGGLPQRHWHMVFRERGVRGGRFLVVFGGGGQSV
ncbi:uncharacterized [Lates japonicus]